jgi:Domain of unknown function (DUF4037)
VKTKSISTGGSDADFIPGIKLAESFYFEAVKPLLQTHVPNVKYTAALLGTGSEILGFDDEMSSDHHWGPRVMLFLEDQDVARYAAVIDETLRTNLPVKFRGYATNFTPPDPADNNTQRLCEIESGPVNHRVEMHSPRGFFLNYLDFDIDRLIEAEDWLSFPAQKLRTITAGAIYHDDLDLQALCERFNYYPRDVWLYLLASGWNRIGEEEHLMGRAGIAGDEIGSSLIAARLVRDLMQLCFLMEQQYPPYAKWFGTAFARLQCAGRLAPILTEVLQASDWKTREQKLVAAYEFVAGLHNQLKITEPLPTAVKEFFGRPFLVIHLGSRQAEAIQAEITDPVVKRIAERGLIGSIDQFSDNTDILSDPGWRAPLRKLFE